MHELAIANGILEAARKEAARLTGQRPAKVGVRIGELAGVDPDALHFCFEALVQDSDLGSLELEIEFRPRQHWCPQCKRTFRVVDYAVECPHCGNPRTEFAGGEELELAYLEVVEHEPLATGR